jgi:hypothetical protein
MRFLHTSSVAAIAGISMLALSMDSVSAFTLSGASLGKSTASTQFETVYYRGVGGGVHGVYRGGVHRGYGYRGGYGYHGYGYGGAAVGAAVIGGAALGAAVLAPHCWINSYGARVCN